MLMFVCFLEDKAVPISEGIDDSESRASENEVIVIKEVVDDQRG